MLKPCLLYLLFLFTATAFSQTNEFRLMPEAGLSLPTGDFKAQNVFGSDGYLAGLNLDMFWGNFGLGLYGGINNNGTKYVDGLPPIGGLIMDKSNQITSDSWKQLLVGLGPIVKFPLFKKFDFELSSKFGFSKFSYPDYTEFVETGDPLDKAYIMYQTRNQDVKQKLNAMLLSTARVSYKPSQKIAISLGANYTATQGVLHSYSYLDGGFNPEMTNDELTAAFLEGPRVTEVRKCNFNTIGITLGVGITLGGKSKQKDDQAEMEPPIPQYPPDGAIISPEEADSLVLQWQKETPNVAEANYNLWLYEVADSTHKEDSLIYQTLVTRSLKLDLPDNVQLRSGSNYRWRVQAVGPARLKPCPGNCYSINATFRIGIPVDVYVELQRQLDGGYYISDGILRFKYDEEYTDKDGKLTFNIYDDNHHVVASNRAMQVSSQPVVVYGDNRYVLNVKSCTFSTLTPNGYLGNGFYVLEVINEKNEKWYLRFKNELSFIPNCPPIIKSN